MSQSSPAPQALQITGPAGPLEALVELPATPNGTPMSAVPREFAVICHPHPLHGGTMYNKVVHILARALLSLGMPVIRFNYRGVGASAGRYAEGIGETADALAVIAAGRERWPGALLTLGGFSFGGAVALRATRGTAVHRLITVAPAVDRVAVDELPVPMPAWLLVQGDADDVVSQPQVRAWTETLPCPPQCVWLPGVGHFFHGALTPLQEAVRRFAQD